MLRLPNFVQRVRRSLLRSRSRKAAIAITLIILIALVLGWKLQTLVPGLSREEFINAYTPVGWHGIYRDALNLPLKLVQSAVFWIDADHGALTSRLPNVLFGLLAIINFGILSRWWLGQRIALMATALFACSAWTLHVSRYVNFDIMYLWGITTLLLSHAYLHRRALRPYALAIVLAAWGLLLYIPGMVWLLLFNAFAQRRFISAGWRAANGLKKRIVTVFAGLIWLPLLALTLRHMDQLRTWSGLPNNFAAPMDILKEIAAVPYHALVRGPENPVLWLGKAPVLDVFSLVMAVLGIYFYVSHLGASRAKLLLGLGLISTLLIGLGGPVSFSIIVPLLFIVVATGIAFLLREWLKTFPVNPIARNLGLGLVVVLVLGSCIYNLRAYYVAWPHATPTQGKFTYKP